MKNILLFASGGGSNVKAILEYFKDNQSVSFPLIITNKAHAGVIEIAKEHLIDVLLINKQIFNEEVFIDTLESYKPDLLVLAGFLWKIPDYMIMAFPNKIINIHPALLPKYGGKGMYGHFVHEAVIANHEKESGITIHFVNEHYDEGTVLLQKSIPVSIDDVPEELAKKVLKLEHEWYAKVIESLLKSS
ncbi:MAG: phosphoribosylglycinamide formyltransferase [Bacteroidetes bacterium]|jgi:phosphoribosylglycinamide formyltransferase-1|nr:phosphoribosylglycinamide formyltransferase [Bacteroidota bacterium]